MENANLDLDKVIFISDIPYNVNAVNADSAGCVANYLTVKTSPVDGGTAKNIPYNGSATRDLTIVDADGGKFKGPIEVPNNNDGIPKNQAVLNYYDIKEKVVKELANNCVTYSWISDDKGGYTLDPAIPGESNINGISIVTGHFSSREEFANYNFQNKQLSSYLYICTQEDVDDDKRLGNIYFGTASSNDLTQIARNALRLDNTSLLVDLSSNTSAAIDGTRAVTPGVSGTLEVQNGGTGAANAKAACDNLTKDQELQLKGVVITSTPNDPAKLKHYRYGRYGMDLANSDLIGVNGIYFADASDAADECIHFVNTAQINPDDVTYDRLYAKEGKLYFDTNLRKGADNVGSEVYHAGMSEPIPVEQGGTGKRSLADVSVGQATVATHAGTASKVAAKVGSNNNNISITILPSTSTNPTSGSDGDILIKYS